MRFAFVSIHLWIISGHVPCLKSDHNQLTVMLLLFPDQLVMPERSFSYAMGKLAWLDKLYGDKDLDFKLKYLLWCKTKEGLKKKGSHAESVNRMGSELYFTFKGASAGYGAVLFVWFGCFVCLVWFWFFLRNIQTPKCGMGLLLLPNHVCSCIFLIYSDVLSCSDM